MTARKTASWPTAGTAPFAIEAAADWADYNCAYDPPVFAKAPPTVEHPAGEPVWMQP